MSDVMNFYAKSKESKVIQRVHREILLVCLVFQQKCINIHPKVVGLIPLSNLSLGHLTAPATSTQAIAWRERAVGGAVEISPVHLDTLH